MSDEKIFEQRLRLGRLFDIYGELLTAKQRACLRFYFYDDLSLSEISVELGVSRQAVHDLLQRVEQILERYESKLGIFSREEALQGELRRALALLAPCEKEKNDAAAAILKKICGEGR